MLLVLQSIGDLRLRNRRSGAGGGGAGGGGGGARMGAAPKRATVRAL